MVVRPLEFDSKSAAADSFRQAWGWLPALFYFDVFLGVFVLSVFCLFVYFICLFALSCWLFLRYLSAMDSFCLGWGRLKPNQILLVPHKTAHFICSQGVCGRVKLESNLFCGLISMRMLPDKPTYPAASTSATSHCHSDGVIPLPIEQQDQTDQICLYFFTFSNFVWIFVVIVDVYISQISSALEDKVGVS